MPATRDESRSGGLPLARLGLAAAAVVALIFLGRHVGAYLPAFAAWVEGLGIWGPIVFVAGYATAVVGFVPGALLTVAAGAIFGLLEGVVSVFTAASLGACAAFRVARHLARAAIEQRLEGNERFAAIARAIGSEGRKIVFLLRLSPVFPFNLLNYALGLTRVRFGDYAVACVGMLPGTFLYVYLGSLARNLAGLAAGETGVGSAQERWIFIGGLIVTAVVTVLITRIARRALADATGT